MRHVITISLILSFTSLLGQTNNSIKIISRQVYEFPTWEKGIETTDLKKYDSKENYLNTIADKKFKLEKITYTSEGIEVKAYLYLPKEITGKMPAIIFNRGSYLRGDIAPELVSMFHRLATQGFIIIAPMYRGSDGAQGIDEMGGADVKDLMNIKEVVNQLKEVDASKLFLYGESRGGMMVYQAIRLGFPAKAAAVFSAISDFEMFFNENANNLAMANKIWPNYENEKEAINNTRSAMRWVSDLKIPLLIMHGGRDKTVNPVQALNLAMKMQELSLTYSLIVYANDNHRLSANQNNRDQTAIDWFKSY